MNQLVLSSFTGMGLLDMAFQEMGFCVVSSGDIQWGHDIRKFHPIKGRFNGGILTPPCTGFSDANRLKLPNDSLENYSYQMLLECKRIILEAEFDWALIENVRNVPDLEIEGYYHQRIDVNQGWFSNVQRLRHIQFYCKEEFYLNIPRGKLTGNEENCALASDSRPFKELLRLQGLPLDTNLDSFNLQGKKRLVGNGVPLVMGRVIAKEVKRVTELYYKTVSQRMENVTDQNKNVSDLNTKFYSAVEMLSTCSETSVTDRVENVIDPGRNVIQLHNKFCPSCKRLLTGRKNYCDTTCRQRAFKKRKKELVS